ncbi:hypothetical protein HYH03_001795 [Edaphochlamys debaryana]|uniref:Dienelactone hydrolase domain-containing protein n=1 Tax=Edaphochlamys debaryana TaxID=47281 RepID=A0A836C5Z8_9CHLO|nr:hypothetical protein HYH03_001795 [Edaphochlamys debaryana]|eukprot:KAG2500217.1 hypothetical protein HYH03_001795 [Edaphochlamys debaryana]
MTRLAFGSSGAMLLALAVALALTSSASASARNLLQCKKDGERCSLYAGPAECCSGMVCTMPLECTKKGNRGECQPECRTQTLGQLKAVTFPSAYGPTPGFEGGRKTKNAVVVMQEWWGINQAVKEIALHIAEQGYRVLIPDIYRGKVAVEVMEARGLSSDLNWTRGVEDVVAAVKYLRDTGSKKVGIIGFCQGGAMAFCGAEKAGVDAAIPFYGIPSNTTGCNPLNIARSVPLQAHFGTRDTSFPPTRIEPLVASMQEEKIKIKLHMYEGLPHAFFNAITPAGRQLMSGGNATFVFPNEALVTAAFSRMTNFLRLHVR